MRAEKVWLGYLVAALVTCLCTAVGLAMTARFDVVNIAMVYLLAVVVVALRYSRGAAVACALLCVLALDIVFVPPRGMLSVNDAQYLLTFAIMLTVALVISGLMQSRRRQAEQQTRLEVEAETERIRSTLLASISHDLRTPLTVMVGASSGLMDGNDKLPAAERAALARSIYEQARAMSDQVAKLLQMTRIETGALKVERDWISVPEIIGSILSRLSEKMAQHHLLLDLEDDLPLVLADATLIDQALTNLLENAARHTPAGTIVRVRAQRHSDNMVISVEDFGPGVEDDDMERIFAKFHRGHDEGSLGGIGLGLAIARAIITLHGGKTWAERMPGSGTAFRFTLPLSQMPSLPSESAQA